MRPAGPAVIPSVHASGGARGQYLGHHRFCLLSWMNIVLEMLVQ